MTQRTVGGVDNRAEIREFLATRRAKITPEQAGLQPGSGRRRVPGLRREEVAVLAGVSTEWYVRLEKGHISGVSDEVLGAVARALQMSLLIRSCRDEGGRARGTRTANIVGVPLALSVMGRGHLFYGAFAQVLPWCEGHR